MNLPPGKYWLVVHARTSFANPLGVVGANSGNGSFMTIKPSRAAGLRTIRPPASPAASAAKSVPARPGSAP